MISNCEKVKALGIKVLLFTSNENSPKETSLKQVDNWNEIVRIISNNEEGVI